MDLNHLIVSESNQHRDWWCSRLLWGRVGATDLQLESVLHFYHVIASRQIRQRGTDSPFKTNEKSGGYQCECPFPFALSWFLISRSHPRSLFLTPCQISFCILKLSLHRWDRRESGSSQNLTGPDSDGMCSISAIPNARNLPSLLGYERFMKQARPLLSIHKKILRF